MSNTTDDHDIEYYSTPKVGDILGVATETVRDWISSGKIKGVKINGYWRVPRAEVIRLANERHG